MEPQCQCPLLPRLAQSWGHRGCAVIEWCHTACVTDSCVGSVPLPTLTACRAPQECTSPGRQEHGSLSFCAVGLSIHQCPVGLAEGLPGCGKREQRGSEHPSVNSVQPGALAALLVVVAVPAAESSM